MDWGMLITAAVVAADWILRIGLSARVVMVRRSTQASIAWLAIIFFAPFIGAFVYLLIGENRLGRRRAAQYARLTQGMDEQAVALWKRGVDWTAGGKRFDHVARLCTAESHVPALGGNTLTIMSSSEQVIRSICADIDAAQRHCHVLTYIWQVGGLPDEVVKALMRAAARGVMCRVLVDAHGAKDFLRSDRDNRMRKAGVEVMAALPVGALRMLFSRMDLRNHRKIVEIDGGVAYVGSQNMTDRSFRVARNPRVGPWIDATVRVEGPGAQALGLVFLKDWLLDAGSGADVEAHLPDLGEISGESGAAVQVLATGPGTTTPGMMPRAILELIYAAREELILTTPYFVPGDAMLIALESAAQRGVEVSVIVPRKLDTPLVHRASNANLEQLLETGVRIYRHGRGLLHAKTITVDRELGMVGSANLDMRSFWLNFEVAMMIYDTDTASQLRMLQREYMEESEQVFADEWRQRGFGTRLVENGARLLSPLL
ncbi:MAG: cardiolipin synthase [Phycisphaerales bacterium]